MKATLFSIVIVISFLTIIEAQAITFDFEKEAQANNWKVLGGKWKVEDGAYVGESNEDEATTYTGEASWLDTTKGEYTIEFRFKVLDDASHFGLAFRENGKNQHYSFYFHASPGSIGNFWVGYWDGSYHSWEGWAASGAYDQVDDWNSAKVIIDGFSFEYYINEKLITKKEDANKLYKSGFVGFVIDGPGGPTPPPMIVAFDDLSIDGPGIPVYAVSPGGKLPTIWGKIRNR